MSDRLTYLIIVTVNTNYNKYSLCISASVHFIFMAPGIEPGNLIRSTLIRFPPGPFLLKLSNKVIGVKQNIVENIMIYHLGFV